jgi:methylsterol monooxygenase
VARVCTGVWGTFLVHELHFLVANAIFGCCDWFGWFRKYRVQGDRYPPPEMLRLCVAVVLFNHICVALPGLMLTWPIWGYIFSSPLVRLSTPLPAATTIGWQVLLFALVEDFIFYWVHRGLHHRSVYKHIHKLHHRFSTPITIATEFAHPVEFFVANTVPLMAGPLICAAIHEPVHVSTLWLWMVLRLSEAVDGHCGYEIPWSPFAIWPLRPGAAEHDWHHSKNVGNFGSLFSWWDEVCLTSRSAYLAKQADGRKLKD